MGLLPRRTDRFEAFVAPAADRPELWRLVAGSAIAALVWLLTVLLALSIVGRARLAEPEPFILTGYLAAFAGLIAGLALAARLQHRRFVTLFGPGGFQPRRFLQGVAVVGLIALVATLPMLLIDPPRRQLGFAAWAAWLPLVLPALLVQIAAEELAFRGWLMQGLGARFRSRLIWWLLPALLFGLMHWNPVELGDEAWIVVAATALAGLILGDVTARTGNVSLAMGLHFANNAIALLVLAMPSSLSELSLFLLDAEGDPAAMRWLYLADLATTAIAYLLWLLLLARRFDCAAA